MSGEVRCWYLNQKGKATGPYAFSDLKSMAAQGQLKGHDLVFREGSAEWKRAYDWPELVQECFSDENRSSLSRLIKLPEEERAVDDQWVLLVREDGEKEVRFRQKGPFQTDEIRRMLVEEKIKPSDHIWKKGAARWVPLYDVPEFRVHNLKMTKAAEAALQQVASMPGEEQVPADPFAAMMPSSPDPDLMKGSNRTSEAQVRPAEAPPAEAPPAEVRPAEVRPAEVSPAPAISTTAPPSTEASTSAATATAAEVAKKSPAVRASIPGAIPLAAEPLKSSGDSQPVGEARLSNVAKAVTPTAAPEKPMAPQSTAKDHSADVDRQAIREWAMGLVKEARKNEPEAAEDAIPSGKAQVFSPEITQTDHEIPVVANPSPAPQTPSPQSLVSSAASPQVPEIETSVALAADESPRGPAAVTSEPMPILSSASATEGKPPAVRAKTIVEEVLEETASQISKSKSDETSASPTEVSATVIPIVEEAKDSFTSDAAILESSPESLGESDKGIGHADESEEADDFVVQPLIASSKSQDRAVEPAPLANVELSSPIENSPPPTESPAAVESLAKTTSGAPQPGAPQPAAPEPVAVQPVAVQPVAAQPAAAQSVAAQSVAAQSAAAQSVAAQSAAAQSAAAQPVAPSSEKISASPVTSADVEIPRTPVSTPVAASRPEMPAQVPARIPVAQDSAKPAAGVEKVSMPIFATGAVVPDDGSAEEVIHPARLSENYSFEAKAAVTPAPAATPSLPAAPRTPGVPAGAPQPGAPQPAALPNSKVAAKGAAPKTAAVAPKAAAAAAAAKETPALAAASGDYAYDFEPPKTFFSKAAPFFGLMVIAIFGAGVWATLRTDKSVFQTGSSVNQASLVPAKVEPVPVEPVEAPPARNLPRAGTPPVPPTAAVTSPNGANAAAPAARGAESPEMDEGPEVITVEAPPAPAVAATPVAAPAAPVTPPSVNPAADFDGKNPIVRVNAANTLLEILGPFRKGELLRIRIEGRAGQILDLPALVQKYEARATQDHYYRVSLREARIPKGEYLVAVQFGMNRFSRGVGFGKDGAFREALQGHRKSMSYDQQQERKRLLAATKDFAKLLAKAESSAKDAAAIKALQRELEKKTPRELRLVRTNRYELIFFDYWEKLAAQWERIQVTMKENPGRNPASATEFNRARKMANSLESEVRSTSIWN